MILLCAHLDQMLTHAASREVEVCGVLIGRRSPAIAVEIVIAGHNIHATPDQHFLLDAAMLLRADAEARTTGREIVGFYHSHPRSAAVPSRTDRHESWPDHLMLLVGMTHSGLRYACGWIIDRDGLPIPVPLLPGSSSSSGH
jgi:desampylase